MSYSYISVCRSALSSIALSLISGVAMGQCLSLSDVPARIREARLVALGETHGTMEAPAFAARLLCALANAKKLTLLGLEIPGSEQSTIDAFVSGGSEVEFRNSMRTSRFWNRDVQDGRSSMAMVTLIEFARDLRMRGRQVRVLAFDVTPSQVTAGITRDKIMALNLESALRAEPDATILLLVGNMHNRKAEGAPHDATFRSAVNLMSEEKIISLLMQHAGGSAWFCANDTEGKSSCGVKRGMFSMNDRSSPKLVELDRRLLPDYDGYFFVGAINASPPAVERLPAK